MTAPEESGDPGGTVPGAGEDSGETLPGDGEDSGETSSGEGGDSGETPPEGEGGEDIEARIAELMQQKEGMEAQLKGLRAQLAGLEAQKSEAEAGFEEAWSEIAKKEQELSAGKAEVEAGYKELEAGREELKAGEEELAKQEEETARKLEEGRRELEEGKLELDRNQYKVNEGWREYEEGRLEGEQKLADGYTEYMDGKAEGEQKLADGWREYEEGRQEGEQKLADGRKELEEGVAEGRQELDDGWKEYEEGKQEAEEKLGDARKKIDEIDMAEWYIQDRTALSGYVNIGSDADSIESIGTVFPVVFFIVAFLMSLTTVTRMVEEDRGLIGTYKALGFTNREIRRKYLVYTAAAGILGSAGGTAAAFIALPAFIFTIFRKMYLLPFYRFTFTPLFGISGPLVFFIGILGAAVLACRGELRQVPAALMRPKAPRLGSGILLEKVSFVWNRLSFLRKVTARNLFRYKKRMFMTVFGIGGCMALLLFGFAIRDSVHDLMPRQYEETTVYDILAVRLPGDLEELQELVRTQTADGTAGMLTLMVTTGAVRTKDGEELSEQIFVIPDGEDISPYIHLIPAKERTTGLHGMEERRTDEGETELKLSDGMIAFTQNASSVLGFREGDDVELRTVDLKKAVVPAGVIVKNYLGNSVFMNAATYRKYFAEPENNAVLVKLNGMDGEEAISAYERIRENDIVVSSVSREKTTGQFEDAFILINAVVYIVILMSAALAFVVLFTLSLTNISEREREMATIKVLGFYDYEVHSYINRETFILTGIGIAAGIPLGYAFAQTLTAILNLPSIYLAVSLHRSSYLMAAGLTILFAILVSLITNRMLDRINPVEALKSVE